MNVLENLYEEIQPKLYNFFFIKTSSKEVAEDLTQEVFYQAIKSYTSFKGNSSLTTWMFSIAYNILKKYYRKNKYDKSLNEKLKFKPNLEESIDYNLLIQDEKKLLKSAISELDETSREIVILRIYSELTFKEIGKVLTISENYARVSFYRAKAKIKEIMGGYYEY